MQRQAAILSYELDIYLFVVLHSGELIHQNFFSPGPMVALLLHPLQYSNDHHMMQHVNITCCEGVDVLGLPKYLFSWWF